MDSDKIFGIVIVCDIEGVGYKDKYESLLHRVLEKGLKEGLCEFYDDKIVIKLIKNLSEYKQVELYVKHKDDYSIIVDLDISRSGR